MHRIYWFSGTGNTLKLARDFSRGLGEAELIPIASLQDKEAVEFDADCVGIFFPVYCFGLPRIVSRFLERAVKPDNSSPYIYGVCTSGGMPCATLQMADEILKGRGMGLSAGFSFVMPGNYIPLYGAPSEAKQRKLFDKASAKLQSAVASVKEKRQSRLESNSFVVNMLGKLVARRAIASLAGADRWFWTDGKCDGCGLCAKVCPARNIEMKAGRPVWKRNCEQCMACLQWCPKEALQFRKASLSRKRYRHPETNAQDIVLPPA